MTRRKKKKQTKRGVLQDLKRIAPVPKKKSTWANNPNRYDWPGIDLPSKKKTRKRIGGTDAVPLFNKYDEGILVKQYERGVEVTVPKPPRFGGGTRKKVLGEGAALGYIDQSVKMIKKKKKRGRWT